MVKLYDRKHVLIAADTLNDRVLPFFEQHGINLLRILTDRSIEYLGAREHHEKELNIALEDIDHSKTKSQTSQTNGICERLHRTMLEGRYGITFRK